MMRGYSLRVQGKLGCSVSPACMVSSLGEVIGFSVCPSIPSCDPVSSICAAALDLILSCFDELDVMLGAGLVLSHRSMWFLALVVHPLCLVASLSVGAPLLLLLVLIS